MTIPGPPPRLLRRHLVEDRIREGASHRLLLITGPAGQGKTTCTAEALRGTAGVAWVSLKAIDQDPRRFWSHVLAALEHATGVPLADIATSEDLDDSVVAACQRFDALEEDAILVLDDPSEVLNGQSGHILDLLLDEAPDQLHVVILSRRRPVKDIERRRARGEVAELGPRGLGFSEVECASYLNTIWELGLDAGELARIHTATEGWPVALRQVAAYIADERDEHGPEPTLNTDDGAMIERLVMGILDGLTDADRRFLLDISVLDGLHSAVCEAVAEQTDARARLDRLHRAGLVVPIGMHPGAYRHRPLVRGVVLTELRSRYPGREAALHSMAAAWSAQHGFWKDAVDHAIDARDVPQAVLWLESHVAELVGVDGGQWFARTLTSGPVVDAIVQSQQLSAACADLAMLSGDRDALEHLLVWLEDPELRVAHRIDGLSRVRGYLSRLRGDGVQAVLVHRSGREVDPFIALPLGAALGAEGRHKAAHDALRLAVDDAHRTGDALRELIAVSELAWQRALAGAPVDADLLCRRASACTAELGFATPPPMAVLARAQIALDRGRTEVAREQARRVQATISSSCDLVLRAEAHLFESRARLAHGDVDHATRALDRLERTLSDSTPSGGLMSRIARARASMMLGVGDVDGALVLLPTITGDADGLPPEDRLLASLAHLRLGNALKAQELADTLRDEGIGARLTIRALRIKAAAAAALGDELLGVRLHRQAEQVARAVGLLVSGLQLQMTPDRILVEQGPPGRDRAAVGAVSSGLAKRMTDRELAVLRLLPSSTNVEIATNLYVSVNTVKTHLKSIHRKLDVSTRDAAVRRGRALGLI